MARSATRRAPGPARRGVVDVLIGRRAPWWRRRGPRRALLVAVAALVAVESGLVAAAPGRLRPPALPAALVASPVAPVGSGPDGAPVDGPGSDSDGSAGSGSAGSDADGGGADGRGADGADVDVTRADADWLARAGVVLAAGWEAEGLLDPDYDPLSAFASGAGAAEWPERIRARRELVLADEPFRESAVIGRSPAPCYHFHRAVRDVTVGLPDPAGAAIRADLLAWLEPPYFSGVVRSRLDPRCVGRPRSQYGFAMEEAYRTPCVVPPGAPVADVRCFVVGQWAYHLGERDTRWSAHLVYDRSSGELLLGEDLHVGVPVDDWRAFVDRTVCVLGGTCDGVEHRHGQVMTTEDALIVWFSPGEAADVAAGTLRLVVPWEVVARLATGASG
jgi:hypothetical protein